MDKHRYLRTLSLDLRGTIPTLEEHAMLEALDDVPEDWIDEWLSGEAFADRALRLHVDMLWLPIVDDELINRRAWLRVDDDLYYRANATEVRGNDRGVGCFDEPAVYGVDGEPVVTFRADGYWREGYEWVTPYWAPDTQIKLCAFDAREREYSSDGDLCAGGAGAGDTDCGCGPGAQWCVSPVGETEIARSLVEDVERRIRDVVLEDRPYTDLFTSTRGWVNGPMVYYWTHLAPNAPNVDMSPTPIRITTLPDLDWVDGDTWVEVELGPHHAGVLTSAPYLLRFNSNRARANRFFERFLCRPFVPPAGGIPTTGDELVTLDLQQREGCLYCHAMLEPAAAHWGRWPVNGAGFLEPVAFPPTRDDCVTCATTSAPCNDDCRSYYVTEALGVEEEPFLGMLRAYEFRNPAHEASIEQGPALLARRSIVDGSLPACSSRTAARWLLGTVADEADSDWYEGLGDTFVGTDFSWRALVRAIVTSDVYRSMR